MHSRNPAQVVRLPCAIVLAGYVERFYATQKHPLPAGLIAMLTTKVGGTVGDGALTISNTDAKLWDSHYTVGVAWTRAATPEQLAWAPSSLSPEEKAAAADAQKRLEARCVSAVAERARCRSGQG